MGLPTLPSPTNKLLIVSVSPQNLERGILWFKEKEDSIKKARLTNPWWRDNSLILEKDLIIKPAELARRLLEFGYERSRATYGPGLFAVRGGIIEIWPVNQEKSRLIEFAGNTIASIHELTDKDSVEAKSPHRSFASSIEKLRPESYVVHIDHGIGIFRGVVKYSDQIRNPKFEILNKPKIQNSKLQTDLEFGTSGLGFSTTKNSEEFFVVEYAPARKGGEPDKLFVPVLEKDRLSPYVGFETPTVHRLGGALWQNTKRKIREGAEKLAKELLELYAKRSTASRAPHFGDQAMETELKQTFSFAETDGQTRATEEILADLSRPYPMDRVLCGDVGFGKTEVAIRTALRVIASGGQVAVLAPTTILAAQHEKIFQERLDRLPVAVKMLSRLTPPSKQKKILREAQDGKIDCLVGTHKLFSKDLKFKNLGLLIIDEEQRFGVKQKEYFKGLRAEIDPVRSQTPKASADPRADQTSNGVDILSLSATPIPRTLSLALAKLRDISLIDTPPPERLAIKTLVLPHSAKTIRRALEFEISRGGQVYFLHNRIETLGFTKKRLEKLTSALSPKPKIGILHGRMKEKEIIKIMDEFREKKIDILVTTTIIENGLDISSANTLIVDDAARLGLAQAHQLRGRIGRGREQAFAYFLYRPNRLTEKAEERLGALKEYAQLGDGYRIAMRDLEIRGAGNILGREQSGAVNKVGLNLYCQILNEVLETKNLK